MLCMDALMLFLLYMILISSTYIIIIGQILFKRQKVYKEIINFTNYSILLYNIFSNCSFINCDYFCKFMNLEIL